MKKLHITILILLLAIIIPCITLGANSTTVSGRFITVTGLDADWYLDNDLPYLSGVGLRIKTIKFWPSAANDIIVLRNSTSGSASSSFACFMKSIDGEPRKDTFQGDVWYPFIDISYCTLSSASGATVVFEVDWDDK